MNQSFHKNMSRPISRLNSAPRQGQMAKQDGTKVLGRTTSQSDTSSLTFVCDCTKLRMLLKSRLHQLLRWSNCTNSTTVREIVIGCVFTFKRCLNGGTSVTKWVLCVIDYKQTPLQTDYSQTGSQRDVIDNVGQETKKLLIEFNVLSHNYICSFQRLPNWSHPILRPVARVNGQVIFTKVLARAASKKQGAKTAHIRTLPP